MNAIIQRLIDTDAPMQLLAGASDASISEYEKTAGVKLPGEYREWLQFSNGGEIFVPGTVFFGVGHAAKRQLAAENMQEARRMFSLGTSLLVIGRLNFGDVVCIDLQSGEVIEWDHETDEEFLRWGSFFEFLADEIESYIGVDS